MMDGQGDVELEAIIGLMAANPREGLEKLSKVCCNGTSSNVLL